MGSRMLAKKKMGRKKEEKKRTGTDRIQDKTKMGSKKMRSRRGHAFWEG